MNSGSKAQILELQGINYIRVNRSNHKIRELVRVSFKLGYHEDDRVTLMINVRTVKLEKR